MPTRRCRGLNLENHRSSIKSSANFASIDFETANLSRVCICAAGVIVFEDGILTESRYWLVRPPNGHGWFRDDFIEVHGLTHLNMFDAPEFPAIAPELSERLTRADPVVAHHAEFDIDHLRETLNHFGLACPEFDFVCICQLVRRVWPDLPDYRLDTLAAHINHQFNHHHAQTDAETAGRVLLAMMKQFNVNTPHELLENSCMETKHLGQ